MKPAIIVLNWNGADDALECIDSLARQTLRPAIIIVDNNSHDDSVERFKEYISAHPKADIDLIENQQNLGFAGGINTGIRRALKRKFRYIGTLNPDATADKNWCKYIIDELKNHKDVGIATGLMLRQNSDTVDSSGDFYTTWGLPGPRNRDEPRANAPQEPGYIFGATGGGVIFRAQIFDDIDPFDKDFFMYYEDIDISFRAQLAGWKARYTPRAIAYHKVSASSSKVPGLAVYNTFKNLPLVFIKNVPGDIFFSIGLRFFATYWLIFASAVRHGNGWPALKGALASLAKQPKAWKKRRQIQKNRRVSTDYLKSIIHQGPLPNQTGLLRFKRFFNRKTT